MGLSGYENLLFSIEKYRVKELSFYEIRSALSGSRTYDLGQELQYEKDLYKKIDAWFEFIEFCYLEDDWRDLTLSICNFIENAIQNEPRPLELPKSDRVIRDQGLA